MGGVGLGFAVNCLTVLLVSATLAKPGLKKETRIEPSETEHAKLVRYRIMMGTFLIIAYATFVSEIRRIVPPTHREFGGPRRCMSRISTRQWGFSFGACMTSIMGNRG